MRFERFPSVVLVGGLAMRVRRQVFSCLFACFLLCCSASLWLGSPSAAWAQSTSTGTVVGSVTDPSGALVGDAKVILTDTSTNIARSATTNAAGRYTFVDVNPGIYSFAVSKPGFSTAKVENQKVEVGASVTLNLALQVG